MTLEDALATLRALAEPGRAEGMAAYHKQNREVIGIPNPALNDITQGWRQSLTLPERLTLASDLWQTDIFEARIAAAKLLTQARIRPDAEAWALIQSWLPDLDSWAIADHAMTAGQKRLSADLSRIEAIEGWTTSESLWTRRAALVATLPLAKKSHPKAGETAARERVLGWAESYVSDPEWFIQKAVAWWLRDLSKHDPARTAAFLDGPGQGLKPFARREAGKYL
ncbi:DNA alkylation repair protein [Oceanicola sp. 502str15]|uniref:DNA alkylation repair protein n=1 Tax=Oceanicola sp. 502str15 TaxID=2696061 RepID=UPI0020961DD8|nr:DNA alkylation repair protein [Oceanicola sp. 502str15]MCO6381776.1 DNA alkylation repair protein [Oceanicola sp. 502str15]